MAEVEAPAVDEAFTTPELEISSPSTTGGAEVADGVGGDVRVGAGLGRTERLGEALAEGLAEGLAEELAEGLTWGRGVDPAATLEGGSDPSALPLGPGEEECDWEDDPVPGVDDGAAPAACPSLFRGPVVVE